MLDAVYPHYLCPMPSMCIVQLRPIRRLGARQRVHRPTRHGPAEHDRAARPDGVRVSHGPRGHAAPIELVEAQYHDRDLLSLELPRDIKAGAVIRLRIRATAGLMLDEIEIDRLPIHLRGSEGLPYRVYER